MNIIKLVLHRYKRLFLNDITHLVYTPKAKTQIILGQNGAGKSSLLEQLTPLAANLKKDFNEEGYKEIHISHNDEMYILKNGPNNKHSFVVDGDELNDSGTISVQNKLTESHFGVTPHIQHVLLGKNQFTTMSPTERKKWITDMSTIDYKYPITAYNALKNRHRDIVGGIKLLQANVVRVKKSSLPDEVVSSLLADKAGLSGVIDHLFTLLNTTDAKPDTYSRMQDVSKLVDLMDSVSTDNDKSVDDVKSRIQELTVSVAGYDAQLAILYKDLVLVNESVTVAKRDGMLTEVNNLEAEIVAIKGCNRFSGMTDITFTCRYMEDNYSDIVGLLSPLSEYGELDVTRDRVTVLKQTLSSYEGKYAIHSKAMFKLEERLVHLAKHLAEGKDVTCPKCTYAWNPDYDSSTHTATTKAVEVGRATLTELEKHIKETTSELTRVESVREIVSSFVKYLNVNDDTRMILSYVKDVASNNDNFHSGLFNVFELAIADVFALKPVLAISEKLNTLRIELDKLDSIAAVKADITTGNKESLLSDIDSIRKDKDVAIAELKTANAQLKNIEDHVVRLDEIKLSLGYVYSAKSAEFVNIKNNLIKSGIAELRSKLLDIDNKLTSNTEYDTMLTTYQTELTDLNNKERVLKLTLKELSPSEGLIAKSISSFLNYFIQDMNSIISTIWGYDMEILSCDLDDNDLDYKFRVLVNNDEIIEDVGKTSSSMQEMINLVFKIIFSKYQGFIGGPLILDEFGRTFDANHRITAYEALERSISDDFGQIYMVSHFESMYGRFSTADVSILGTTGVDLNTIDAYNEVMIMN